MEAKLRWTLITMIAPIAWGTTYYVTRHFLPAGYPLWGSVLRAAPAGILLLIITRQLPHGSWWWKSLVLGFLNIGAFFALIYVAAQLLPSSIASTLMATSPAVMMLLAWPLLAQKPRILSLVGAALGFAGVCALVLTGGDDLIPGGVLASVAAMLMSSLGFILNTRWVGEVQILASTSWQLIAGSVMILPIALAIEGAPPQLDTAGFIAFGYLSVVGTAVAYVAWFSGLSRLGAGPVGLIGLLNPVTGVLLGVLLASEMPTPAQVMGVALVLIGVLGGQPFILKLLQQHARPVGDSRER